LLQKKKEEEREGEKEAEKKKKILTTPSRCTNDVVFPPCSKIAQCLDVVPLFS
jgi:hypothetical protein